MIIRISRGRLEIVCLSNLNWSVEVEGVRLFFRHLDCFLGLALLELFSPTYRQTDRLSDPVGPDWLVVYNVFDDYLMYPIYVVPKSPISVHFPPCTQTSTYHERTDGIEVE
jgi:hypothetical protein